MIERGLGRLVVALCLGTVGCLAPTQPWQRIRDGVDGAFPETAYLLSIDPAAVEAGGPASLARWASELERRYVRDVEVEGVVWQPFRSTPLSVEPDRYGSGGDSMLFTGIALTGWTWKYAVTGDSERVIEAVRGLWILTHVAGPGVPLALNAVLAPTSVDMAYRMTKPTALAGAEVSACESVK